MTVTDRPSDRQTTLLGL